MPKKEDMDQKLKDYVALRQLDLKSTPAVRTKFHPGTFYDTGDVVRIVNNLKWKDRKAKVLFSVKNPQSIKSSSYYRVKMLRTGEVRTFKGINLRAYKLVDKDRPRPGYVFKGPYDKSKGLKKSLITNINLCGYIPPYGSLEVR